MQSDALESAATSSSETAASTGCTRLQRVQAVGKRTLITDVHSAKELHAAWTADHRGKVQVQPIKLGMVASSCYLVECSQQLMAVNFSQHV